MMVCSKIFVVAAAKLLCHGPLSLSTTASQLQHMARAAVSCMVPAGLAAALSAVLVTTRFYNLYIRATSIAMQTLHALLNVRCSIAAMKATC